MASLDDMEDFRERMTKAETGLVVVGGANEKLVVSGDKKRLEAISQAMVDRCIADEIHDFVSSVLSHAPGNEAGAIEARPIQRYSDSALLGYMKTKVSHTVTPTADLIVKEKPKKPSRPRNRSRAKSTSAADSGQTGGAATPQSPGAAPSTPPARSSPAKKAKLESSSNVNSPTSAGVSTSDPPTKTHTSTHARTPAKASAAAKSEAHKETSSVAASPSTRTPNRTPEPPLVNPSAPASEEKVTKEKTPNKRRNSASVQSHPDKASSATSTAPSATPTPVAAETKQAPASAKPSEDASAKQDGAEPANTSGSPTSGTLPGFQRHYDVSYGVTELPTVISQTSTRTGRKIKAPKAISM